MLTIVTIHPFVAIVALDTVAELFVTIGTSAAVGIFDNCGRATFAIAGDGRAELRRANRANRRDGGRQSAILNCPL